MKLFEHIAGNGQTEELLLFHTVGPHHDRWLICDSGIPRLPTTLRTSQDAAVFAASRVTSVRKSPPDDIALSLFDVFVCWRVARYDALLVLVIYSRMHA